ncbi:restriction endonuclease subunit S [Limnospira platensis]|uniref:restriction endonuclease subunit S n=1 Tax=Limnospira platensis TaxID=118562 RepID=UPI0002803F31|nr:putative type I restriction-modification system subunit S [Arthrospira platensis C1]UWU48789.1 type I restriction enzyme, S subunit [Arthrospira platensis C1]
MATKSSWIPLSQLCEAIVDCEHKTAPVQDSGIPSIRTTNIKNGRLDLENANLVSEETYKLWTARLEPQPNDLILAREAPVGEVGIVPRGKRVCLGQRTVLIRPDGKKLFPRYLLYLLLTPEMRHEMTCRAEGSVVPHLNMSDIRNFEIPPPPPLDEQKAIAHILGTFDDKIELNQQMNRTLEAIARAIFKSWFIDFDPVRAKMDQRQPAGMDAETAALFPDEFEDSPLGKIPKGWEVTDLGRLLNIYDSKRIPLSGRERTARKGIYPYYGAASVMDYVDDYLFDGIYVLVGEDGSVVDGNGYPVIQYVWGKFWVNNHAHVLQGSKGISTEHLKLFLHQVNILPYVTGAVQPKLNQANMRRVPFILAPERVNSEFDIKISRLFAHFRANSEQNSTLTSIRDSLLPKLLSGEICVKDAEKVLEEVM